MFKNARDDYQALILAGRTSPSIHLGHARACMQQAAALKKHRPGASRAQQAYLDHIQDLHLEAKNSFLLALASDTWSAPEAFLELADTCANLRHWTAAATFAASTSTPAAADLLLRIRRGLVQNSPVALSLADVEGRRGRDGLIAAHDLAEQEGLTHPASLHLLGQRLAETGNKVAARFYLRKAKRFAVPNSPLMGQIDQSIKDISTFGMPSLDNATEAVAGGFASLLGSTRDGATRAYDVVSLAGPSLWNIFGTNNS